MLNILLQHNFRLLYQITPETSIVEYRGSITESDVHLLVSELQKRHTDWFLAIEKVIVYEDVLKPEQVIQRSDFHADKIVEPERFYGMGVPQAWELGYTGKGIVIAVTDVGMHTNLLDLTNQIDEDMCYNYINDNRNITPEFFHNHQAEADKYATHGDQCASLIASEYGNGLCSSGIAFNATRVGLKIFEVTFNGRLFDIEHKYWTRSDIISRAFANNSGIDIYSNAWAPEHPFTPLDLPTKEAIRYGGEEGRMGLGTIYVVPAGPVGNELANNIYTIAVNGIGVNGSIHNDSKLCASVITSGLADGSNISARYMLTTTRNNNCVTSFKGVSPATAQIAAIIGLALEANPNLTLRDIQHLLIQSSEYVGKVEKRNLIKNGAGRLFHKVLGYGLLNATKLVVLAETRQVCTFLQS
ncbi:furin-1-like [Mercenaria mercenaria]|uniref:furin-1-like n=1 Tax=Mercenaria mercenaria TaxID=6596 RepID=UPI00234E62D4|nr:furin-1-like [Mercenaria mercenaria]